MAAAPDDEATEVTDDGATDEVLTDDQGDVTEDVDATEDVDVTGGDLEDPDVIFYSFGGGIGDEADSVADDIAEQTASNVLDEIDLATSSSSAVASPN
jgi:hypothetical protein